MKKLDGLDSFHNYLINMKKKYIARNRSILAIKNLDDAYEIEWYLWKPRQKSMVSTFVWFLFIIYSKYGFSLAFTQ